MKTLIHAVLWAVKITVAAWMCWQQKRMKTMKLKTLLLTFTAAAILAVVPSQAKAQMSSPGPQGLHLHRVRDGTRSVLRNHNPLHVQLWRKCMGGHVHVAGNQRSVGSQLLLLGGVHKAGRKARISRSGKHRLLGHAPTEAISGDSLPATKHHLGNCAAASSKESLLRFFKSVDPARDPRPKLYVKLTRASNWFCDTGTATSSLTEPSDLRHVVGQPLLTACCLSACLCPLQLVAHRGA